ncbi:MAG: WG repeat-containing protein [Clostridia bacterium]
MKKTLNTVLIFICVTLLTTTSINVSAATFDWTNESQYDYTLVSSSSSTNSDFFSFEDGDKTGLVNQYGKIVIPAIYDRLWTMNENLVCVIDGDFTGVLDTSGNVIIPIEYDASWGDNMAILNGSRIRVIKNDAEGLMDLNGNWIIPLGYEWMDKLGTSNNYIVARKNGMYRILDNNGNIILENYEEIDSLYNTDKYIRITQNGLCGIADYNANVIIPTEYESINFIKDNIFSAEKSGQWGLIDTNNNTIIPFEYKWVGSVANNIVNCYTFDKKDYLYDLNGNCISESKYYISEINSSDKNLIFIEDNDKHGAMNSNNEIIVPLVYDSIEVFSENLFAVQKDGLYGLIDMTGNVVLPIEQPREIRGKDLLNNDWITDDLYKLNKYKDDVYTVGLINSNGKIILPMQYNSIELFNKDYFVVSKDGYEGIVDKNGNEIIPIEYEAIIPGATVLAVLEENSGWKFAKIDDSGNNKQTVVTSFGSTTSTWAAPEIEEAFENDLIPEVMIGFDLTKKVNRGEFAAIAVQLYEVLAKRSVEESPSCTFTDIQYDDNEKAIKKAYQIEVAQGTSTTTYEPLSFINREQLATMLCRVIKKYSFPNWTMATDNEYYMQTDGVKLFADDNEISTWAKPSVYFMSKYGIIKGVSDTHFAPKNTTSQQEASGYASATREQAIILAQRIFTQSDLFGN